MSDELPPNPEIRPCDDGSIDEWIGKDIAMMHVERMDNGHWWIGVTFRDGSEWSVRFFTKRNAHIGIIAEEDWPAIAALAAGGQEAG